jgi:hypothetical protein
MHDNNPRRPTNELSTPYRHTDPATHPQDREARAAAQGVELEQVPSAYIRALAQAYVEGHRAELIRVAYDTVLSTRTVISAIEAHDAFQVRS